jgi:hypothetical protein
LASAFIASLGIGNESMTDSTANEIRADDETRANAAFFDFLDGLWRQGKNNIKHTEDSLQDFFDGDGNDKCEVEHADEDIHGFEPYFPNPNSMQRNQIVEQTNAKLETVNGKPSEKRGGERVWVTKKHSPPFCSESKIIRNKDSAHLSDCG